MVKSKKSHFSPMAADLLFGLLLPLVVSAIKVECTHNKSNSFLQKKITSHFMVKTKKIKFIPIVPYKILLSANLKRIHERIMEKIHSNWPYSEYSTLLMKHMECQTNSITSQPIFTDQGYF